MPKIIKSAKGSFTLSSITVDGDGRVITAATGSAGGVSWQTGDIKTGNFTASADEGYFCNTSGGGFTLTLPSSPSAGNTVAVADYGNDFAGNNLTIGRNSEPIEGVASDLTINQSGAAFELIYVDGTKGWVLVADGNSGTVRDEFITATGGTITCCGDFKVHTFTGPGTFAVTAGAGPKAVIDYVVVAGGGGGGNNRGGGGGGGGFRAGVSGINGQYASPTNTSDTGIVVQTGDSIPVTVGDGGGNNANGSNSVFSTITATGGGAGGAPSDCGSAGGSGGGGGHPGRGAGNGNTPAVFPPQGNRGGNSGGNSAGGGGGADQEGTASPTNPGTTPGGAGGAGATNGINFSDTGRAGGGGGGTFGGGGGPASDGAGAGQPGTGQSGTANTGGGAGGGGAQGSAPGGTGGSGVVLIRYKYQ